MTGPKDGATVSGGRSCCLSCDRVTSRRTGATAGVAGGGPALDTILQLALNGLAVGCIYGLVALGFVLIYKATELVNFAQGDLLMLGAFVCYMFVVWYGVGYWAAFALAVAIVALFGAVLDATLLRRVIGQPQFAVVMLTIGLGAMFRSFASMIWGSRSTRCRPRSAPGRRGSARSA